MGIPLLAGRAFAPEDGPQSLPMAIVNDTLARRHWPGQSPLGRQLRLMLRSGPGRWLQVVGVVGNVRHHGLDRQAEPEVYVPYAQSPVEGFVLMLRAPQPGALASQLREVMQGLDPTLPLSGINVVSNVIDRSLSEPRMRTLLFNAFASIGLLLVAIGIYGVVAYSVTRRTRDIGVRMALGAPPSAIVRQIVGHTLAVVAAGAAVGLLASLALTSALTSLLFEIRPNDPATLLGVTALLFTVALVAAYLPARAATRLDPLKALRTP